MKYVKVLKKDAQKVKKDLIRKKILSRDYHSDKDEKYIYFPVTEGGELEREGRKIAKVEVDLGSFDTIGDVVIVGEDVSDETCNDLLKRREIKVVLRKKGIHHGEFRTQDLEIVCGENRKDTMYKENGVNLKLDVEKCYFSPRLSTERMRVAKMVKSGEKVLVLFSGVAPYCAVLAMHTKAEKIVGVEKNPVAHEYAVLNCKKFQNVEVVNADAKDFKSSEKFDRVLMPLPKSAEDFLDVAVKYVKKGGVIHFYDFLHENDIPDAALEKIKAHVSKFKVLGVVKCGHYSPGKFRICVDLVVQ
ncbi:class I SAM-dependent methyltransferase family protein [archaeon]|jgi:tRNA (guanine37-N1)-methyltransferase|nr:class I SAM-dependent methyltransferase family protein [archaeon]